MIEFNKKLLKEIEEYCLINNINDIEKYANDLLKKAFMEDKYGKKPHIFEVYEPLKEEVKADEVVKVLIDQTFDQTKLDLEKEEDVIEINKNQIVEEVEHIEPQSVEVEVTEKKKKKRKLN